MLFFSRPWPLHILMTVRVCPWSAPTHVAPGMIDAASFGTYWMRLEPILLCLRTEQLGWLWRHGHVSLFVDRAAAVTLLQKCGREAAVLRISSTLPGKLTISVLKDDKAVHQQVTLQDAATVLLGAGKDCKSFGSVAELLLYLHSLGYRQLVARGQCCACRRRDSGLTSIFPKTAPHGPSRSWQMRCRLHQAGPPSCPRPPKATYRRTSKSHFTRAPGYPCSSSSMTLARARQYLASARLPAFRKVLANARSLVTQVLRALA